MKVTEKCTRAGTRYFELDYTLGGKRRRMTIPGASSMVEAQAIAAPEILRIKRLQRLLRQQVSPIVGNTDGTLLLDLLSYHSDRPTVRPRTAQRERDIAKTFGTIWGQSKRADRISEADVRLFIERRRKAGCRAVSINKELRTLRAALRSAEEKGFLFEVPRSIASMRLLPTEDSKRWALTVEETDNLIRAAREYHDKEMLPRILVLLHLGLRPAELWDLRWSDIDFDEKAVLVRTTKRGGAADHRTFWLPLPAELEQLLRARREARRADDSDLVFGIEPEKRNAARRAPSAKSGRGTIGGVVRREDYNFRRKLRTIATRAGVAKASKITPYILRHTFGTRLAETTTLHVGAALMKHTDLRTMATYAHAERGRMREAIEGLHDRK